MVSHLHNLHSVLLMHILSLISFRVQTIPEVKIHEAHRLCKCSRCFQTNQSSLHREPAPLNTLIVERLLQKKLQKKGGETGQAICLAIRICKQWLGPRKTWNNVDGEDRGSGKNCEIQWEQKKNLPTTAALFGLGEQHLPEGRGIKKTEYLITSSSFQNSSRLSISKQYTPQISSVQNKRFRAVSVELLHAQCSIVSICLLNDQHGFYNR